MSKCPNCGAVLKDNVCEYCGDECQKTVGGFIRNRVSVVAYSGNDIILTVDKNGIVMLPGSSEIKTTLEQSAIYYLKKRVNMHGYNAVKIFEYDGQGFQTRQGIAMNHHHVFYVQTDEKETPQISSGWITKIIRWNPLTSVPAVCTHETREILSKIQKEYIDKSTGKFVLSNH